MGRNTYSVKQINAYIKNMFQQDYMLNRVYVRGEVSNCKYHSSGHIYFSLKDESGTIACVMFAGQRSGLTFRMCDGQQIIVFGSVQVYERDGKYQLYAKQIKLDGEGVLYEKFLLLKQELEDMGMFAPEYKKPLPKYAKKVGIVTASTGAAIRDIINVSKRRNPYIQLYLYPAQVQGIGAKESIVKGIRLMEQLNVDVMIVGRGGGSIEDLWAFNEEEVARAIFESSVPVISAVGHETDFTIADYVADFRAPTPSAGAEIAVFDYSQYLQDLNQYQLQFKRILDHKLNISTLMMQKYETKLLSLHPRTKVNEYQHHVVELEETMKKILDLKLLKTKHQFSIYVQQLKNHSPLDKLSKGYAYTQDKDGHTIKSITQVQPGSPLTVYVTDGAIDTKVINITPIERE